jgi:hypothetical protein
MNKKSTAMPAYMAARCRGAHIVYTSRIQTFVRVPPDVISLQLCTPIVLVYSSNYTVYKLHLK